MRIEEFDYHVDLLRAVLWQYDAAPKLISLMTDKQGWYNENQEDFWSDWYRDVFNLQTANDFGLTVWALILEMPLFISLAPDTPGKPVYGYGEFYKNYNNGYYANVSSATVLSTAEKRLVLKLRYFQLVTRGAIPEINKFMAFAFKDFGQVYAVDGLDMSMTYVFDFQLTLRLFNILKDYDILPRPAGVLIKYLLLARNTFGFGEFYKNYNNGTYIEDSP